MSSVFQLQAVIEAPDYKDKLSCLWDVATVEPGCFIRLSGNMTYPEIGLVFAQIVRYNRLDLSGDIKTVLQQIVEAESLVLPGGLQAVYNGELIQPSCCCGLETWREWYEFLETKHSPWLGHDPSPWVEWRDDKIRIWADGGLDESLKDVFYIDVTVSNYKKALNLVNKDLQAFLFCVYSWLQEIGFKQSKLLV